MLFQQLSENFYSKPCWFVGKVTINDRIQVAVDQRLTIDTIRSRVKLISYSSSISSSISKTISEEK